jgi:outer membrane protein assembly factor BamB
MKILLLLGSLISILMIKGCGEDIPKEYPYKPPRIIWKTKLADTGLLRDLIEADIQYKSGVLFPGVNNTIRSLYLLDSDNGGVKWKWSDYLSGDVFWSLRSPYQFQDRLLVPEGRNLYCIDLETGATIWKQRMEAFASEDVAFGDNQDFFLLVDYVNDDGSFEVRIAKGNLNTRSEPAVFLTPDYSRKVMQPQNGLIGDLDGISTIKINEVTHLLIFFGDPNEALYDVDMFIGLYNLVEKQWVYSKKPSVKRAKSRCGRNPIIDKGKVFNICGFTLICHDLATGEQCWSKTVQTQPFSQMGLVNGKIIITSQDSKTRCLKPENGEVIWELPTEPNPSFIRDLNGIAYFIGGGGRFYAIDVDKGKIIWDFVSPDISSNPPAYFMRGVRIIKGNNNSPDKVLVASEKNAFCYEATR